VVHLWDLRKAVGSMSCVALCGKDDPVRSAGLLARVMTEYNRSQGY
jgi:hypothetical protein